MDMVIKVPTFENNGHEFRIFRSYGSAVTGGSCSPYCMLCGKECFYSPDVECLPINKDGDGI